MENLQRIELFGFPGSGKTTALHAIGKQYSDFTSQKANISFNFKNSFALIRYLLFHPKSLQLFKLKKNVPIIHSKTYQNTIIRFLLRMMVAENNFKTKHKIIVDEGILQITWSLLLLPSIYNKDFNSENELKKIIKNWWPKETILVYYIKINHEEYIKRINTRERRHFFSEEFKKGNKKYISKGEELFDLILQKAEKSYKTISI